MKSPYFFLNIFSDLDLNSMLFGDESFGFLLEVIIRTFIMFMVILLSLRIMGKRNVAQLSVFELGVIIGLGSAAGDPMFYKDVGLLPSILAFLVIIVLYRVITNVINHNEAVEKVLEGTATYIAEHGHINLENFEKEPIAHEEFFTQLRLKHVTHLGQVKYAILETNGLISVVLYSDEEVKWGLPVLPHLCDNKSKHVDSSSTYACAYCGHIHGFAAASDSYPCPVCENTDWIVAINEPRIA